MLAGTAEKSGTDPADERVNDDGENCASEDRQKHIWHSDQHPQKRREKFAAKKCGEIGGDERSETRDLARQTTTPTTQDFEQNQNQCKRNKSELPKWRTRCGLRSEERRVGKEGRSRGL